ncbi:MAG: hypothetical protein MI702_05205 [Chlorobiales bacterium]|nr:hypothetical protein [Chlorobiales bacterium]
MVVSSSSFADDSVSLKGHVYFEDDLGEKIPFPKLPGRNYVRMKIVEGEEEKSCGEKALITDSEGEFAFDYKMPVKCAQYKLRVYIDFNKLLSSVNFKQKGRPVEISVALEDDEVSIDPITIIIPLSTYSDAIKSGFLKKGMASYSLARDLVPESASLSESEKEEKADLGLFYFVLASEGDDIKNTRSSIEFLKKLGYEKDVYNLFALKNMNQINSFSNEVKFGMFRDLAHSQKAILESADFKNSSERLALASKSLAYYAMAQEVKPEYEIPVTFSREVMYSFTGKNLNYNAWYNVLSENKSLINEFNKVLINRVDGKKYLLKDDLSNLNETLDYLKKFDQKYVVSPIK